VYFVSETDQVELKSVRVYAPACASAAPSSLSRAATSPSADATAPRTLGPARYPPPTSRHHTQFDPSFLEIDGVQ